MCRGCFPSSLAVWKKRDRQRKARSRALPFSSLSTLFPWAFPVVPETAKQLLTTSAPTQFRDRVYRENGACSSRSSSQGTRLLSMIASYAGAFLVYLAGYWRDVVSLLDPAMVVVCCQRCRSGRRLQQGPGIWKGRACNSDLLHRAHLSCKSRLEHRILAGAEVISFSMIRAAAL